MQAKETIVFKMEGKTAHTYARTYTTDIKFKKLYLIKTRQCRNMAVPAEEAGKKGPRSLAHRLFRLSLCLSLSRTLVVVVSPLIANEAWH